MNTTNPITEDDIANFLANTPEFFERHSQVLASVQLTSPHGNRAVSLQERQAEMLREKIKGLEHRIMDMVRHGNENVIIADKLQRWARSLLLTRSPADLPERIAHEIEVQFSVPQAAIKVWGVADEYAHAHWAQGVSEDAKIFASSLTAPFCGVNSGFEAVTWLAQPAAAMSLALMPLRTGVLNSPSPAFGMLVLASPDAQRFESAMGTDFLERIAELAGAALSRLRA
ncbi:uncharacterized protein YigA (DUF484 family) [Rhodoferax ferrireducens]|uniref:Uncharacterized protein YigA (DUF484 family) n=1 Tax=Rhodoferax ferrireducens TaxID=192843 RepID=A0ABU2CFR3_9BURK|nr:MULTISPECIES: DUF484 family protein [Rhodoferax]MDR7380187.1 uncharacterized protein YigA (DUF484 family) [Rhodoferax ferrireducens]SDO91362.1 hypothetical protein SAMN05216303_102686 [Rhodoferax sp. OV413]